jgi:hypothetical protein
MLEFRLEFSGFGLGFGSRFSDVLDLIVHVVCGIWTGELPFSGELLQ